MVQPVRRKVCGRSELGLPQQCSHLKQQQHVQRKQDDVQDENGVYPRTQPIADKSEIAAYRGRTQAQHRAHTECEEDKSRREITHAINQCHYDTNPSNQLEKNGLKRNSRRTRTLLGGNEAMQKRAGEIEEQGDAENHDSDRDHAAGRSSVGRPGLHAGGRRGV